MSNTPFQFHLGLVTSRDPSTLRDGELTVATGCEYRIGSPHLYKLPGRSRASAALGAPIRGINKLQYDTGASSVVAVAGGTVYGSAVGSSLTFTSEGLTGLTSTAIPQWGAFQDRWVLCDGQGINYIREPNNVPGTTSKWRRMMQSPATAPTSGTIGVVGATSRPTSVSGTYANPSNAVDSSTTTYAVGQTSESDTVKSHVWKFTANPAGVGRTLYVSSSGRAAANAPNISIDQPNKVNSDIDFSDPGTATHKIEYTLDFTAASPVWVTMWSKSGTYTQQTDTAQLVDGVDYANKLAVRATVTNESGGPNYGRIHDIFASSGASAPKTFTYKVVYCYTEQYIDSDGQVQETAASPLVEFEAGSVAGVYGITLTVPTRTNAFATNYRFYRSVDEQGGGYPNMYKVGSLPASATPVTWTDNFSISTTLVPDDGDILQMYEVLYFTGDTIQFELNSPPPASKMCLPFQGCMVYMPSDDLLARRLYYSIPSSISSCGIEKVPVINYLEFVTPKNDGLVSMATANGNNVLLVYFEDYTMVVGYLPQATDPNVFDNRVKENVSNVRGAAGRDCVCSFTMPNGDTLVAAVDRLGLWVTNGSGMVQEWSNEFNWTEAMADVDLSTATLIHNPIKRRLELLYDGDKELHFFFGAMKQDGDGAAAPKITGPHAVGYGCKYFGMIGTTCLGFSGDSSDNGYVFLEEGADADAANGYDTNGSVPFVVRSGDRYLNGLGRAQLCEFGYPKFATNLNKEITASAIFVNDIGTTTTITQTFEAGGMKKLWWHHYADRHSIQFSDISATACPALVAYELEVRDAGVGRQS